ncbi:TetR/AcrR family transcriptional regulator [Streptomyces hygroscopicus]|uniref:TetR/AcrR family transcriptional regulator n=1 Tax=Streptomyces hygroscopicus TaxID=1912 RepID=UPI0033E2E5EB
MTAAAPSALRESLRERKKRRTRQALIDTALELFTQRGFGGVTLDELCEEVEVSKRTFFRTFTSKEDVAMAPDQDLWRAFLGELETAEPDGLPVVELGRDALLAALERMDDEGWTRRLLLSRRLAERTPSMGAHGLQFCEATTQQALEILHRRFGLGAPGDLRPRLAVDMLIAAFRGAVAGWVAQAEEADGVGGASRTQGEPPPRHDLAARLREAIAALPESLALTTTST